MIKSTKSVSRILIFTAAVAGSVFPVLGQRGITIPVGTVIPLRMETSLSSENSKAGDRFTATVSRALEIQRRVAIPEGSKVEGRVTAVNRADRRSRAGTIAIGFERLVLPEGQSYPVDGTLTTLDDQARAQLEADEEGRVEGSSQKRRAVIFIGGGAGVGAVIGAVAGGGKGAAVGAGLGAVLGTIGTLLGKGDDAEIKPGTEFGLYVERAFTIDRDYRRVEPDQSRLITSPASIRAAQSVLRDRGYYSGIVDGRMGPSLRTAIRQFQRDRKLTITGDLDAATASELGILDRSGSEAVLVAIENPRAEWVGRDSIRITADARTQTRGWQVYADQFVSGTTMHVYIRGVRPEISAPAIDRQTVDQTFENVGNVTRVIFHGADRDYPVALSRGPGLPGTPRGGTGDARQIAAIAIRLLNDYQRDLNVGGSRGSVLFDSRRTYRQGEIDLLSQFHSLVAAADLYQQAVLRTSNQDVLREAADGLLRQARFVTRVMRRNQELVLSRTAQNDWEQLKNELARITITDNNIDTDVDRIR